MSGNERTAEKLGRSGWVFWVSIFLSISPRGKWGQYKCGLCSIWDSGKYSSIQTMPCTAIEENGHRSQRRGSSDVEGLGTLGTAYSPGVSLEGRPSPRAACAENGGYSSQVWYWPWPGWRVHRNQGNRAKPQRSKWFKGIFLYFLS